jgi:hypothetical protein
MAIRAKARKIRLGIQAANKAGKLFPMANTFTNFENRI